MENKIYYTIVVGHPVVINPRFLIPRRLKRDRGGNAIPSKFGVNQFYEEECPRTEIDGEIVHKWTTPKTDLDSMSAPHKKIINDLKYFLVDRQCAVWYHNANCDAMSEFGGRHLHLVFEGIPAPGGGVKQLFDCRRFRALKDGFDSNGGYIRSQKVRNVHNLLGHFKLPPRIFMGTKSDDLAGIMQQLSSDTTETAPGYSECVTDENDHTQPVSTSTATTWDIDPPSTTVFGDAGPSRPGQSNHANNQPTEVHSSVRPPSTETTGQLDIIYSKLTPGDKTINIIKQLCIKFDCFCFESLTDKINNLPANDIVRLRWATFQHRPGLSQKVASIAQEMRCTYRLKTWEELLKQFKDDVINNMDQFMDIHSSIRCMREWFDHNGFFPTAFCNILQKIMDKQNGKVNAMYFIGPSNAGKTMLVQRPLQWICKFVGRVSNVNTCGNFAWENCVNCRLISIDEAMFAPEHIDKFKQIAGGESCLVDKKFSAPVEITKTPVLLTANVDPWRTNCAEQVPLRNRGVYYRCKSAPWLAKYDKQLNPVVYYFLQKAADLILDKENDSDNMFWDMVNHSATEWMQVVSLQCLEEMPESDTD